MVCFDEHLTSIFTNSKKKKKRQDVTTTAAGAAACLDELSYTNNQLCNTSHQSTDHIWNCIFTMIITARSL